LLFINQINYTKNDSKESSEEGRVWLKAETNQRQLVPEKGRAG
jgi:hypothetical protein